MKLSLVLATATSLVGTAFADGAAIVSALGVIATESSALTTTVSSWSGDFFGVLPITAQSAELLGGILNATAVAQASANLTDAETISVATATIGLVSSTNLTLSALVDAKHKFDSLLLTPIIYLTLLTEKSAADQLSAAITAKVPALYQSVATVLAGELDDNFNTALAAFS
ncbi:hydrophobic surface binding protein A-domain-containing protein [Xylariales sp. PMI_506]|nr:hydrophobic surface binding protein A-domain-containing protein [Xylariales sp. PMI_506]